MKCKIDGCERDVMYKSQQVCQRHYFRFMRYGTYDLTMHPAKYRISNPAGYQKIYVGSHELGVNNGYIYEHRKIVFDVYGFNLPPCEICGKETLWETCHIDHIDKDVTNNSIENLRPVCRGCNTSRTERSSIEKYEIDGVSKSLTEWSKEDGVTVGRAQVLNRLKSGMTIEEALFSKNITHQNTRKLKNGD